MVTDERASIGYQFAPHERPMMPGSPATPDHPAGRRIGYFCTGVLVSLTGGFVNGLLTANLQQIQGALGLTSVEAGWLTAAYSMTNVCMSLLLIKFRQQFGIQRFARIFLIAFLLLNTAQLFVHSFGTELVVRATSGVVASGLSTLGLFFFMQAMPAEWRLKGLVLGIGVSQLAVPLARVISPTLLMDGDIQNLFLFELGLTLLSLAAVFRCFACHRASGSRHSNHLISSPSPSSRRALRCCAQCSYRGEQSGGQLRGSAGRWRPPSR